jgi:hypothetical protein
MHDILMITYRRAEFTRLSLGRLLDSCDESMRVWIWHNGDHRETLDVVRSFQHHARFHRLEVSEANVKLRTPTNWFWANSDAAYLSKVDDDCLVTAGWASTLRTAHAQTPELGLIACWLFYPEDYAPDLAAPKMRTFNGGHRIMTHGFVQGSGYVMKRAVYDQIGPIQENESFTTYGIRAAYNGWINGWYFPFIRHDHMDDARSPNYPFKTDDEYLKNISLSKSNFSIKSIAEAQQFSRMLARRVQGEVIDPRDHFGWRKFLRTAQRRIFGFRR